MEKTTIAEKLAAALAEHGLNPRSQRRRTGVDHVTVRDILGGAHPQMQTVVRLARGFGEDVNEWLVSADYEPLPPGSAFDADTAAGAVIREARDRFPSVPGYVMLQEYPAADATPEQVATFKADLFGRLEELANEQGGRPGAGSGQGTRDSRGRQKPGGRGPLRMAVA